MCAARSLTVRVLAYALLAHGPRGGLWHTALRSVRRLVAPTAATATATATATAAPDAACTNGSLSTCVAPA
jgi:hypothetical protein